MIVKYVPEWYNVHMTLLVDANIFLAVILNEPEKAAIIDLTKGCELVAPEVLPYEIGNALSAMNRRNRLNEEQIVACYEIFRQISVRLVPADIRKSLKIVSEFNTYAYDAYYLEVASRLNVPLLSLDKNMLTISKGLNIKSVEVKI